MLWKKGREHKVEELKSKRDILRRRHKNRELHERERERERSPRREETDHAPMSTDRSLIREKPIVYNAPLRSHTAPVTLEPVRYISRTPVKREETVINQPTLQEAPRYVSKYPYMPHVEPVQMLTGTYQPDNGLPTIKTSTSIIPGRQPTIGVLTSPSRILQPAQFSSPQPRVISAYNPQHQPHSSIAFRNRSNHPHNISSPRVTYLKHPGLQGSPVQPYTSTMQPVSATTPLRPRKERLTYASPVAAPYEPEISINTAEPRKAGAFSTRKLTKTAQREPVTVCSPTRPVLQPQNMNIYTKPHLSPHHRSSMGPHKSPSFLNLRRQSEIPQNFTPNPFPAPEEDTITTGKTIIQKKVSTPRLDRVRVDGANPLDHPHNQSLKPVVVQDTFIIEEGQFLANSGQKPAMVKRRTITTHHDMMDVSDDGLNQNKRDWKGLGKRHSMPNGLRR